MAVRPQTDISANSGTKNKSTTKGVVCLDVDYGMVQCGLS